MKQKGTQAVKLDGIKNLEYSAFLGSLLIQAWQCEVGRRSSSLNSCITEAQNKHMLYSANSGNLDVLYKMC